jgi:Leucine-rich repeat (LRR) protein
MIYDKTYYEVEKKIEQAQRLDATELDLSNMNITQLPESIGSLTLVQRIKLQNNRLNELPGSFANLVQLKWLDISNNAITSLPESFTMLWQLEHLEATDNNLVLLPESFGNLEHLHWLNLYYNRIATLPESIGNLKELRVLNLSTNQLISIPKSIGNLHSLNTMILSQNKLKELPDELGQLSKLRFLNLTYNQLVDIPPSLSDLNCFESLYYTGITENPLSDELQAAYKEGIYYFEKYLRAKVTSIKLNEAKLIVVGEGEVGKSCLLSALRNDPFVEGLSTTHGIEIKPIHLTTPDTQKEIIINGWDFGGQRIYRPTHQLFFSAPAVYLVVWKPREGLQQGLVKEWIQLIKYREPDAKILVVATHGGPQQRQPDIDRQELWDLFSKETVIEFFFVDSKPDEHGNRKGIEDLKLAISQIATALPEMGRSVPKSFQDVRQTLQARNVPYLPFNEVLAICHEQNMDDEIARLFITISHRLGHLTHYQNDPTLRDIVILRPDWLSRAISYIFDDEVTRKAHGLVEFSRLSQLWSDTSRPFEARYPEHLHKIFLRLMERFDLSYRVVGLSPNKETNPVSLIAQLVPDNNPEETKLEKSWQSKPASGDIQQTQICRIVDAKKGQSANAEGLFYQLIVRLHKFSLGRDHYNNSVHWQRGLVLDDDYNGRALVRYIDNDIHITVRAPFPERFLAMLTEEVKYLVESFWQGLRCDVMVPCLNPNPCSGLFEVGKLIKNTKLGHTEQPCPICNDWQNIELLLRNAPAARPLSTNNLISSIDILNEVRGLRNLLKVQHLQEMSRFDYLELKDKEILSKIDLSYDRLMLALTDEAKEGPRLFSLIPIDRINFNPKEWIRTKFRLTLWCEHSRLPLPNINGKDSKKGVYEFEIDREWFKKTVPFLKILTGTLSLVLPLASSGIKLALDDVSYAAIEEELDFGKSIIDASIEEGVKIGEWMSPSQEIDMEYGDSIRAQGSALREFHALLKSLDKVEKFGGLVRVMNKRQEFLWVHEKYASEY